MERPKCWRSPRPIRMQQAFICSIHGSIQSREKSHNIWRTGETDSRCDGPDQGTVNPKAQKFDMLFNYLRHRAQLWIKTSAKRADQSAPKKGTSVADVRNHKGISPATDRTIRHQYLGVINFISC